MAKENEVRLCPCDVTRCEARCCYDGVYLLEGEEAFLRELLTRVPELAAKVPAEFVVDGYWQGEPMGRKTATRPHDYKAPDFPAHFAHTRCVFADAQGFCSLESFARERGLHPWTFKPAACWLHPLEVDGAKPEPPPVSPSEDPYRSEDYPGYSSFTPCGRNDPQGLPWRKALAGEIDYLKKAPSLPLLGTPGNTVEELLKKKPALRRV